MAIVLIVEGDEQVRVLAESILKQAGYQTLTAGTEEQATALLRSGEGIDILFTDLELGGVPEAGLMVAQEGIKLRKQMAVLYATAQTVTDGMRALFVDGSRLVPKPYTSEQLLNAIQAKSL